MPTRPNEDIPPVEDHAPAEDIKQPNENPPPEDPLKPVEDTGATTYTQ